MKRIDVSYKGVPLPHLQGLLGCVVTEKGLTALKDGWLVVYDKDGSEKIIRRYPEACAMDYDYSEGLLRLTLYKPLIRELSRPYVVYNHYLEDDVEIIFEYCKFTKENKEPRYVRLNMPADSGKVYVP